MHGESDVNKVFSYVFSLVLLLLMYVKLSDQRLDDYMLRVLMDGEERDTVEIYRELEKLGLRSSVSQIFDRLDKLEVLGMVTTRYVRTDRVRRYARISGTRTPVSDPANLQLVPVYA